MNKSGSQHFSKVKRQLEIKSLKELKAPGWNDHLRVINSDLGKKKKKKEAAWAKCPASAGLLMEDQQICGLPLVPKGVTETQREIQFQNAAFSRVRGGATL